MTKRIYSILAISVFLLFGACVEEESGSREPLIDQRDAGSQNQCDPSGQWDVTITTTAGTCFEPGIEAMSTLTVTLAGDTFVAQWDDGTQPDVGSFDRDRCTMILSEVIADPQTAEFLEWRGTDTTTIQFADQSFTGTGSIDVDTYDSGAMVGSCTQGATLVGQHR